MKSLIIIALVLVLVLTLAGCSEKATKLTKVDINSIHVPDGFDYQTVRPVNIHISGIFKQTVKITTMDDVVLFRGLVDPVNGLQSRITLSYAVNNVKIIYGTDVVNCSVGSNNLIDYSFLPTK